MVCDAGLDGLLEFGVEGLEVTESLVDSLPQEPTARPGQKPATITNIVLQFDGGEQQGQGNAEPADFRVCGGKKSFSTTEPATLLLHDDRFWKQVGIKRQA